MQMQIYLQMQMQMRMQIHIAHLDYVAEDGEGEVRLEREGLVVQQVVERTVGLRCVACWLI